MCVALSPCAVNLVTPLFRCFVLDEFQLGKPGVLYPCRPLIVSPLAVSCQEAVTPIHFLAHAVTAESPVTLVPFQHGIGRCLQVEPTAAKLVGHGAGLAVVAIPQVCGI